MRKIVPIANGEFVVTNARAVFGGDNQSFEVPLAKITNCAPADGRLSIHAGTHNYILGFDAASLTTASATVLTLAIKGGFETSTPNE